METKADLKRPKETKTEPTPCPYTDWKPVIMMPTEAAICASWPRIFGRKMASDLQGDGPGATTGQLHPGRPKPVALPVSSPTPKKPPRTVQFTVEVTLLEIDFLAEND